MKKSDFLHKPYVLKRKVSSSASREVKFDKTRKNKSNEPPENENYIVCANHIAASDPVVLCYAFQKHQICMMAKKELN